MTAERKEVRRRDQGTRIKAERGGIEEHLERLGKRSAKNGAAEV